MGLDQYLFEKWKDEKNEDHLAELVYWRKANEIQAWFDRLCEEKHERPMENCEDFNVTIDDLHRLLDDLRKVDADHSLADKILPTTSGFFFGSTEYDEYYFDNIKQTIKDIEGVIEEHDDGREYVYHPWW